MRQWPGAPNDRFERDFNPMQPFGSCMRRDVFALLMVS
jgi:hypothetical protein